MSNSKRDPERQAVPNPAPSANGNTGISNAGPRPLPYGVADYFWDEAAQRKELEFRLYALFQRWGYTLVIPPTFEYADTFYARADAEFQTEMYRFPDKDGTLLALRPEMTIPVARLAATRLHDSPLPQRYCYMGSVFRYIEPRAGRQREFFQAGMELIGAPSAEADAEVVALSAAAVQAAEITEFQLVLGQLEYFHGLLQDLALTSPQADALGQAIDRNSEPQLFEFLTTTPLRTQQRRTLEALPGLRGENPFAVLDQAERHCLNHRMYNSLATLRNICKVLEGYDLLDHVYLDLTEINNLGYYTGLSFEVLTPRSGNSLGGGGRYDQLLGSFGHDSPAVGAALGIDRLLHARHRQQHTATRIRSVYPQIVIDTQGDPGCLPYIQQWRDHGLRVAVQFQPDPAAPAPQSAAPRAHTPDDATRPAEAIRIVWRDQAFHVDWPTGTRQSQYARDQHAELLAHLTTTLAPSFAQDPNWAKQSTGRSS
ncbi:MAG: ATP phosphoribosyltransferase regulatory subunit [Litorilinea sp.]